MKQTILESGTLDGTRAGPCVGRLLFLWGCYGLAMEWLWRFAGSDAPAQAAVWAVAIALGLGLVLALREV
ncbi:MAG TPA: hypothetical protein VIX60_00945 [Candidatus Cybelea sp.]